jgi:hypothetical protein
MRTVSYKSIQDYVFTGASLDPNDSTITDAQRNRVAGFINDRLKMAWEWAWWPELMMIEERAFRPAWRTVDTYAAGDEVYYAGLYYAAARANSGVTPGTSVDDWTEVTLTNKYIELSRIGETEIGEVELVTLRDPRVAKSPGAVTYSFGANGIQFLSGLAAQTVWVRFRLRPPTFTGELWTAVAAAAGTYNRDGYLVLLPDDGEVYKAITVTEIPYWLKQEMPYVLSGFVRRAALSDYQLLQGNKVAANRNEESAWMELSNAADNVFGGQGLFTTANVQTY